MNNKNVFTSIIILFVILYILSGLAGLAGLGIISVHTDKDKYRLGENITIYSKNSGITLLCGVPYWYVYKINSSNETLIYWNELKGPQCKLPQEYFGVKRIPVIWNPSEIYTYTRLNVGPQKEGMYKIVVMVRTGGGFNTSASKIITID